MVKLNSNIVNLIQQWLTKVKNDLLKSTMVDYSETKVKNHLPVSAMVNYSLGICKHKQRCHTLTMWHSTFTNNYVAIWCLSRVRLQLEFIKGYVTLWHLSMLISHCDNTQDVTHYYILCLNFFMLHWNDGHVVH